MREYLFSDIPIRHFQSFLGWIHQHYLQENHAESFANRWLDFRWESICHVWHRLPSILPICDGPEELFNSIINWKLKLYQGSLAFACVKEQHIITNCIWFPKFFSVPHGSPSWGSPTGTIAEKKIPETNLGSRNIGIRWMTRTMRSSRNDRKTDKVCKKPRDGPQGTWAKIFYSNPKQRQKHCWKSVDYKGNLI